MVYEDDDGFISIEEFQKFKQYIEKRDQNSSTKTKVTYAVFSKNGSNESFLRYIFSNVLLVMTFITQYLIPVIVIIEFEKGSLGLIGFNSLDELDQVYEQWARPPYVNSLGVASWCPKQYGMDDDYAGVDTTIKLSASMLFLYLLVATPLKESVTKVLNGENDEAYLLMKFSRFCNDMVFKMVSPVINLVSYISIAITTYLLFLSNPDIDQLLLNAIAVSFLIDVEEKAIDIALGDELRERMIAKMTLWYMLEGELPEPEAEEQFLNSWIITSWLITPSHAMCAPMVDYIKMMGRFLFYLIGTTVVACYFAVWFMPIVVYICL